MLRRLHPDQPDSFAFSAANQKWAEAQITKYPEGRQASAIIPLLWRAQEQEGWLTRAAIEHVATTLDMAYIRALEVATFYFMFQLQPVGSVAHIQVCGTTSCMICGAEDLMAVCQEKISRHPHDLSPDGRFSWEEVECLGACANAPMAQIGKDYYEDLTAERLSAMIDEFAAGGVPQPGPQNGRFASEPLSGLTTLAITPDARNAHNASVALAVDLNDTVRRIDGTEVPLTTPWLDRDGSGDDTGEGEARDGAQPPEDRHAPLPGTNAGGSQKTPGPTPSQDIPVSENGATRQESEETDAARPASGEPADAVTTNDGTRPATLDAPRGGVADDFKRIKGVGPKLEKMLHELGFYHLDQIAAWSNHEVRWVDANLDGFNGRAQRDEWVRQAKDLQAKDLSAEPET